MVCVWEDMSDAMVEGQCLNFILGYLGVPVLWVNETEGGKVLAAAKAKKTATLRLVGSIEKEAHTESFHALIPGTGGGNEAIVINTHTDGVQLLRGERRRGNAGDDALVQGASGKAHSDLRFRHGTFPSACIPRGSHDVQSGDGRWLADNPELWNGKKYKAVAGCSVEHLGCTEWKDVNGVYRKTDDIDAELVYTGNKRMDALYYEAAKDRDRLRTITLRGHNTMHFGEGQPLSRKHIPEIALVTAPDYLCSVDHTGNSHMDKFDLDLMYEQLHTFVRCVELIDGLTKKEIGRFASPIRWGSAG